MVPALAYAPAFPPIPNFPTNALTRLKFVGFFSPPNDKFRICIGIQHPGAPLPGNSHPSSAHPAPILFPVSITRRPSFQGPYDPTSPTRTGPRLPTAAVLRPSFGFLRGAPSTVPAYLPIRPGPAPPILNNVGISKESQHRGSDAGGSKPYHSFSPQGTLR